ncbi:MAG: hypothetical protein LC749_14620 [Actinobacteria bacterium]|nr:hypothetical protein [Actinomycetota bacterium]
MSTLAVLLTELQIPRSQATPRAAGTDSSTDLILDWLGHGAGGEGDGAGVGAGVMDGVPDEAAEFVGGVN